MTDSIQDIHRDMLKLIAKMEKSLTEAERLMTCSYIGTDKWVREAYRWSRAKDKLISCDGDA